jgi:hypothetical protein
MTGQIIGCNKENIYEQSDKKLSKCARRENKEAASELLQIFYADI